jgi:hypothetical protein
VKTVAEARVALEILIGRGLEKQVDALIAAAKREAFIEAAGAADDAALSMSEEHAAMRPSKRIKRALLSAERRGCETVGRTIRKWLAIAEKAEVSS